MARLLLYPGEIGPLVSLQAFLRDAHEDARAARAREVAERRENGATASEQADAVAAQAAATAAVNALARGDEQAARASIAEALAALGPSVLEEIPAYQPQEEIDGIAVRFRTLSERERRMLSSAVMAAAEGARGSTGADLAEHIQRVSDARAEVVRVAVAELHGLETMTGPITIRAEDGKLSDRDLEALKVAGLHGVLYDAAITFQVLPAKKGLRFGQGAGSALSDSSAPGVPSFDVLSLDAMGARGTLTADPRTSPGQPTKATHAPVDNC